MDIILYTILLIVLGLYRFNQTKDVSETIGIVETGATVTSNCELPVASNLGLVREAGAYTLILDQFNLRR